MSGFEDARFEILVVQFEPLETPEACPTELFDADSPTAFFDFTRVAHPREGLEKLDRDAPDLALFIANRGWTSPEEMLEYLDDYSEKVPVVIVGDAGPEVSKKFEARGAVGVMDPEAIDGEFLVRSVLNAPEPVRESREIRRLQRAVASAQEGVVICDATARDLPIVYCNDSFEEITGYPRSEVLGRNCRFLQCEETSQERVDRIGRALEQENPITIEILNARRDGERFWNELSITPVESASGEVTDFVGFQRDVTRRVEAERNLERYKLVVQNATDIIVLKDLDGTFLLANPRAGEVLGVDHEEMIGATHREFVDDEQADEFQRQARRAIDSDEPITTTSELEKGGEQRILEITRIPCREDDELVGTVGIGRDVTEQRMLRKQLERRLKFDDLTGLPNRRLLLDRARETLADVLRADGSVAIGVVDLDEFHAVNETFGRDHGDALLRRVAERLEEPLDEEDEATRLSGDEFGLLLRSCSGRADIDSFAERLEEEFDDPFEIDDVPVYVPWSAGFCLAPNADEPERTPEALVKHALRNAECAAERAKSVRGNSWYVSGSDTRNSYDVRIQLENRIRGSLEKREFVPHFQPIYSIPEQRVWALELLARWNHPDEGWIPPGEFIPAAEKAGLLQPLTESLLRRAGEIADESEFPDRWTRPVQLYLNLSPSQVARRDIDSRMRSLADEHVPPEIEVGLEITESQFIDRPDHIAALRECGFPIIVDDFGTGHASLTRLKEIPMDALKLDMEFVHNAVETKEDRAILETAAKLGRQLDVHVVGEGVETEEQLSILEASGCTAAQGFLLGRPSPLEDVLAPTRAQNH